MKKTMMILSLFMYTFTVSAQSSEIKAQASYMASDEAYNNSDFQKAYNKLIETEKYLGKANTKTVYLKIKCLVELKKVDELGSALNDYFKLAEKNKGTDKYNEMLLLLSKLDEIKATAYFDLADNFLKTNNYYNAILVYNKMDSLNPNEKEHLWKRGVAKQSLNDYKGALEDYDKFLKSFDEKEIENFNELANSKDSSSLYTTFLNIATCQAILLEDTTATVPLCTLAETITKNEFKKIKAISTKGFSYFRQKKFKDARTWYYTAYSYYARLTKYIEDEENINLYIDFADAEFKSGETKQALRDWKYAQSAIKSKGLKPNPELDRKIANKTYYETNYINKPWNAK